MGFRRLLSDQDVVMDGGHPSDNAEVAAFLELVIAIRKKMNRWEGSQKKEREKEEGETKKLLCGYLFSHSCTVPLPPPSSGGGVSHRKQLATND